MQLRNWSEIYKHYSTWIAVAIIVLNIMIGVFGLIPLDYVTTINAILGALVIAAKKIKQGLDDINAAIGSEETKNDNH